MVKQRYRKVSVQIWSDDKFRTFSDRGKLAWFFILTHPQMTGIGAMRATIPGLAAELGMSEKHFRDAISIALEKKMIEVDEKSCLITLPNFIQHNLPESPTVVTSWLKVLPLLPECPLLLKQIQRVREVISGLGDGFQQAFNELCKAGYWAGYAIPSPEGMPHQEQEQEQEQKQEYNPPTPPRVEKVDHLCGFDQFWQAYPKKMNKPDAQKAYKQVKAAQHLPDILNSLEKHKAWTGWTKDGGQFIPYPASWLRATGWENEMEITGLARLGMAVGSDTSWD